MLCPRFAVIRNGRLVANTTPAAARQAIEGTIYEGSIAAEEYERLVADPARCVTQAYLVEGAEPRAGLRARRECRRPALLRSRPTLEDAYLVSIKTGGLPSAGEPLVRPIGNGLGVCPLAVHERGEA